ncbi:MAG: high-potential iron-sulfur protein [Candidatus Competibacteraceae bacterium]|uniref:High-potential iron-sulfur protein n=1 Tax=Candidatus Contendobacter odensis Run_B_J11 TaxID=1400861 RepID=A0A7U7J2J4_9GAMM|nr:high-potential iron-sulfur protein [Candidatus Contendobacter odensis]MBK8538043.1 high-potential iron-sulfur protein [Candidatus Competibacteraceae bacterium]MBK8755453.1 high-potential iron-sulfur protein [Candidatus Competibacteraceae bacterium]CDH44217.1 High-potential iron-sulfur protein [Candidatus Contendobacter odensis Run_B_J11]
MTTPVPENSRRRFIKLTAIGLAVAPFANTLLSGIVEAADVISETDPQATALGYKADATKADKRKDATALCSNCNFYSGKAGEASGPCVLFQGKLVTANGWCTAWAKKVA